MKVVIVDDEAMVREWFASTIMNMAPDYQLAGTAHDGLSGLQLCRDVKADIAVVDIKMPGMDGIELIKQLQKYCPHTSSIVLSSYSDFDFARNAMKAGAVDYLLKAEITQDTLREALDHLDQEPASRDRGSGEMVEAGVSQSIGNLLSRNDSSSERTVTVAILAEGTGENSIIPETFSRLCKVLGCSGLCEYVRAETNLEISKTFYLGIVHLKQTIKRSYREIGPVFANRLIKQLQSTGRKVYIGVDGFTADMPNLRVRLTGACKAVLWAFYLCEEIGEQKIEHTGPGMLYKKFQRELEAGERLAARQIMNEILTNASENPEGAIPLILDLILEEKDQILPADLGKAVLGTSRLISQGDLTESLAVSLENRLSFRNRELLFSHPDTLARTEPTARVLDYMSRNYHKDLGLDEVAGLVDLSPGYLSELFHKETGDYFQDHLTKLRVTKAAELLSRTRVPVRRIGELIGYPNPSYFGQVFKKQYGESPGTYRKKNFQGKI